MKKNLLSLICCFAVLYAQAQNKEFCGTYESLDRLMDNNPAIKTAYIKHKQESKTRDSLAALNGYAHKTTASVVYTIPIVFHVLHVGGSENISDAQIIDQVNILNRDFRKLNADTSFIISQFKNLAADCNIEFRLATKDPQGNCTTGITRHYDTDTYWTQQPVQYKYTWDCTKYLNVYVVKSFPNNSGLAAYSSFPGTNTNAMDVIVSKHSYIGSIGTGNFFSSRVMTHEVGHWFDLHHVWGDTGIGTACGDDGVSDTPVTKGWSSCPTSTQAVCNSTVVENHQNYMEYSYCYFMFSTGQAARMDAALNSPVSGRNNLWSNSNLIATGIINPVANCTLVPDFYSSSGVYSLCAGQSILFKDNSYNGTVTARSWSATGGASVAAPGASATSITFPTAGTQTVTLAVANGAGTVTSTRTVAVLSNVPDIDSTYQESFEAPGLPSNFSIINPDNNVTWEQTGVAAATGINSYYLSGPINPTGNVDILETPTYNFKDNLWPTFTFKYAYARNSSTHTDLFKVQASSNCGLTWVDIYEPGSISMSLGSGGTTNVPYFPTQNEFKTYTLTDHPNFASFLSQENVRIRFYFKEDASSGFGNNIFLDDINFSVSGVGLNELSKSLSLKLFPNPAKTEATLEFTLSDASQIKIYLTDITGRVVEAERTEEFAPGTHRFIINESHVLNPGIYFVNFSINGQKIARKLIVE